MHVVSLWDECREGKKKKNIKILTKVEMIRELYYCWYLFDPYLV